MGKKKSFLLILLTSAIGVSNAVTIVIYLLSMYNIWVMQGAHTVSEHAGAVGSNFTYLMISGFIEFIIALMKVFAAWRIFRNDVVGVTWMAKLSIATLIWIPVSNIGTAAFAALYYSAGQFPRLILKVVASAFLLWYFSRRKIREAFGE